MTPRRLYLGLCMLLCMNTQAAEQKALNISVGDWPPYLSADMKHNGVIAHLISDLFADEGYDVRFQFLPWPRAYSAAATGRFDATAVWMHKAEREADFYFSAPLLDEQFVFFHLKSFPFDWRRFDDLTGMTLGGGLEYSYGPQFDEFLAQNTVNIERVSTDMQNFEKLLKERVVLYPQEMNVGYAALRSHFSAENQAKITHHPKPLLINRSYLMLPKSLEGSPALMARFNKRLADYRETGRYERYFTDLHEGKYQLEPTPPLSSDY
ncbi:ABC transporter substrate-binding protein [Pseudomonas sp.]|uniref:substrate-binding periplasmic protein n=1 Tax=Pseudomonas sp. TaxID=306 RepID=UPI00273082D0|nr:transporter substrate-binding domain-containing protein [Pseudomonas sp.]MDP2242917.1 transporter substrate-binding domain-containing protein [Pseudomonas sp.]